MSTDQPQTLPYDRADAERKLEPWWGRLEREPQYPCTTAQTAELLRAVEYQCNHDDLLAFISHGVVPAVPRVAGKLSWGPCEILAAAFACEARRKWKPLSELHRHKASLGEYLTWTAAAQGAKAFIDLADHDLDSLFALTVQLGGDASAVSVMVEAIKEKLRQQQESES